MCGFLSMQELRVCKGGTEAVLEQSNEWKGIQQYLTVDVSCICEAHWVVHSMWEESYYTSEFLNN